MQYGDNQAVTICPAYAGMILKASKVNFCPAYLSRVCGDDPGFLFDLSGVELFVPRMRG